MKRNVTILFVIAFLLLGCGITETVRVPDYCDITSSNGQAQANAADPLTSYQWYLDRLGIRDVWRRGRTGDGIQIAILDDAFELNHEDIRANVLAGMSLNVLPSPGNGNENNPRPVECSDGHGTSVAGIIAAEGDNGLGIKGIAHDAKVFGINYLSHSTEFTLQRGLTRNMVNTAVSSNSWGASQLTRLRNRLGGAIGPALNAGINFGFDGKGTIYVFAAGNARNISASSSDIDTLPSAGPGEHRYLDWGTFEEIHNHPGILLVCAVGHSGFASSYSTPGPNLWVCGLSNQGEGASIGDADDINAFGVPSIDLSGNAGYNAQLSTQEDAVCDRASGDYGLLPMVSLQGPCFQFGTSYPFTSGDRVLSNGVSGNTHYHRFFTGTSAATPIVSGVIALLREENRNLTWRDIKLILAETAEQVDNTSQEDSSGLGWMDAGPTYGNPGVYFTYHHNYGFGLINASRALTRAKGWTPLPAASLKSPVISGDRSGYASRNGGELTMSFTVTDGNNEGVTFIEDIQVFLQSPVSDFGVLKITITSPRGSEGVLSIPHGCLDWSEDIRSPSDTDICNDLIGGFTFSSSAHLGESPVGEWKLSITGISNPDANETIARLKIYGHARR